MGHTETSSTMSGGFDFTQAWAEVNRCLLCHDPPCSKACPGGTDPGTFLRQFRLRNVTGAIRTIKQNNILGGACGHLCPTARLCEGACCASGLDRPVRIGKIQRFLVEHSWQLGFRPLDGPRPSRAERVACLGAGPASLSCAAELAKAGVRVTVFEALGAAGGALRFGVPAHRFDDAFLDREVRDLVELGVEFRFRSPLTGRRAAEGLLAEGFHAVFLAPGCQESTRVEPAPSDLPGLASALPFLHDMRAGRADRWRQSIAGETVVVLGGGSVAMDCAATAVRLGARDVYVVYRRSWAQMPAEEDEKLEVLSLGVHLVLLNQPRGWQRREDGSLGGIHLVRTELGDPDATGRRRPVEVAGSQWTLPCRVAIEAIGQRPAAEAVEWYPSVKTDANGLIEASADGQTSAPGLFAGGDVVRGPALIIQAIADGKAAARSILRYLDGKGGAR